MPRPPVRPEDRQRVARACQTCKSSKKRCDGAQPCGSCSKKGLGDVCRYVPGRRGSSHRSRRSAAGRSSRVGGEDVCDNDDLSDVASSPSAAWGSYSESNPEVARVLPNPRVRGVIEEEGVDADDVLDGSNDTRSSSQQPAVMLSSSSGERGMRVLLCILPPENQTWRLFKGFSSGVQTPWQLVPLCLDRR